MCDKKYKEGRYFILCPILERDYFCFLYLPSIRPKKEFSKKAFIIGVFTVLCL